MAPLTSSEQTVAAIDQPIFPLGIAVAATSDCARKLSMPRRAHSWLWNSLGLSLQITAVSARGGRAGQKELFTPRIGPYAVGCNFIVVAAMPEPACLYHRDRGLFTA